MTPEAGLARPADGEDASDKAPIDPDIDLDVRSPRGETRTQRWTLLIAIAIGGVLGNEARYGLSLALPHPAGAMPWATFLTNVSGCALIGVLMVTITELTSAHRLVRPFLGVGVLGGYTTFSTYILDIHQLLEVDRPGLAPCTCHSPQSQRWPRSGPAPTRSGCWRANDNFADHARRRGRRPGPVPHRPRHSVAPPQRIPLGHVHRQCGRIVHPRGPRGIDRPARPCRCRGPGHRVLRSADHLQHIQLRDAAPVGEASRLSRWPRAPSPRCSRSSRPFSPASAAHG
jgi:CrcB protein